MVNSKKKVFSRFKQTIAKTHGCFSALLLTSLFHRFFRRKKEV